MDSEFWHRRWQNNEIGFHQDNVNKLLKAYFNQLNLPRGSRVLVPLCGKTTDMSWLAGQGYDVVGIELSPIAVEEFFGDLGTEPCRTIHGPLEKCSVPGIDIFIGDIFELSNDLIGSVDAVYDRAALVAWPDDMRSRYAEHLVRLTGVAPQFLICYEYDQTEMKGPPFSLRSDDVNRLYDKYYKATALASAAVPGKLKGICAATETAWHLTSV